MSKITEFLNSLGSTPQEVVDSLEKMEIKGERLNGSFCPIIKAIYKNFPNLSSGLKIYAGNIPDKWVRTVYGTIHIEGHYVVSVTWNDCQTMDPECPKAIKEFVRDFDLGKYPNLIGDDIKMAKQKALAKLTKEDLMALGL